MSTCMNKSNQSPTHLQLGHYLELLRHSLSVDGKHLSIQEVCRRASMSVSTYERLKRALV